jgi:hypothetical protein
VRYQLGLELHEVGRSNLAARLIDSGESLQVRLENSNGALQHSRSNTKCRSSIGSGNASAMTAKRTNSSVLGIVSTPTELPCDLYSLRAARGIWWLGTHVREETPNS